MDAIDTDSRASTLAPAAADLAIALDEVLGSLLGRAQDLLRTPLPPEVGSEVRRIETEALRARAAVRDAVSAERRAAPRAAGIDAARLVGRAVEWVGPRARGAGVRISFGLAPDLPDLVGDPVALEHALTLCLFGVLAGRGEDGTEIVVLADTVWEFDLPWLRLTVADERSTALGGRIPDLALPGEGLGLGVARDVVADHGGRLEIHGGGSIGLLVAIRLPGTTANRELPAD